MSTSKQPRVPSYRLHTATGQARVTIDGRDHYLGKYGTSESQAQYRRLIAQYMKDGRIEDAPADTYPVGRLCGDFLKWAQREYRTSSGAPTGSVENVRQALRALFELFADVDAATFGPRSLVLYRDELVRKGLARSTVNDRVKLVRRAFRWATENERIPATVLHGLQAVAGLRRGRGGARETEPVKPAPEAHVEAALPFMSEPVRAMVQLQLLTGARPGEMLVMRAADIDRSGVVWIYRPSTHKSAWRGRERAIYLGPKAQGIVAAFLRPDAQDHFLFSPTVAELRRRDRMHALRKTPMTPSQRLAREARRQRTGRRGRARDRYDGCSYRQAIRRACRKAKVAVWKPNQLRHTAGTFLRREYGLEVAQAVLGHTRVETTQIYAEADRHRAMQAMEQIG